MPVVNYHTVNGQMVGQSTGTTFTQYLTDALGSVTATVNGKRVTNTYRYKPYGERLAKTGSGPDPEFQWTGDTGSRVTGRSRAEQYNVLRHYSPSSGAWTSHDLFWPFESAYGYVNGNPTNLFDPTGTTPVRIELNAFIHKNKGKWLKEPGLNSPWEMKTDYRDFGDKAEGNSRIKTHIAFDSCSFGVKADADSGLSTRRLINDHSKLQIKKATILKSTRFNRSSFCPGPCAALAKAHISAAYPFLPAVAPTQAKLQVHFQPGSCRSVTAVIDITYSAFPDYELIVYAGGRRIKLWKLPTNYPGWVLTVRNFWKSGTYHISIPADVDGCCFSRTGCMPTGCPCD